MTWNWQRPDWPKFTWDADPIAPLEARFLKESGHLLGTFLHLNPSDQDTLRIDLLSEEALKTSRVEGEILDRASLQSSIQQTFGLKVDRLRPVSPAELGIANLMATTFHTWDQPLTDSMLCGWHHTLMDGRLEPTSLGAYRTKPEPMQIVTGDPFDPQVQFEAPPSASVPPEMQRFVAWFNQSHTNIPALTRAAIAHLQFVTVHPFVDGNGRLARVLAEKAIAQAAGQPLLASISQTIEAARDDYYHALATTRFTNHITDWIIYLANTILTSIQRARQQFEFVIAKTKFFDHHRTALNRRQEKVLLRIFREGPDGFQGGLSAANYIAITKTSPATARRDLSDLVTKNALTKTGNKKGTRYHLLLGHDTAAHQD